MKTRFLILFLCLTMLSGCSFFSKVEKTGIQVMTNEVPSSIFINGQFIAKTPLIDKTLSPGEYTLKIVPDDGLLVPYETSVILRKGLLSVITWKPGKTSETSGGVLYEMEPLKNKKTSEISFVSEPEGTIITLDNNKKEFAPKVFTDVTPGNHSFEVTLPSYETQNHTINVVEGFRMIIKIQLAKSEFPGSISVTQELTATPAAQITPASPASPSAQTKQIKILPTDYFVDNKEVLKVRSAPNASSPEIGVVEVGKYYAIINERSEWFQIQLVDKTGWVSSRYGEKVN